MSELSDRLGRQLDDKAGAVAHFAVGSNRSTVLLNYSIGEAQSEASAFARFFRCEKRLKQARLHFRSHSATRVADRYARVTARMRIRISAAIFLVQSDF